MTRMRLFWLLLVLILGVTACFAQTPVPIPITGNLGNISGGPEPDAYVQLQMQNCSGGYPVVTGFQGIVQTSYRFAADTNGNINGNVWANDQITCSGTSGATQYAMTIVVDDTPVGQTQCYQVVHTQGSWNVTTQPAVTCTGTPPNPQDASFNNIFAALNISGNTGGFAGNVAAGSASIANAITAATVNGVVNPAVCANASKPTWCAGSDLGAWINAAGASCNWDCVVAIPPGNYTEGTTLLIPLNTYNRFSLLGVGANITFNGSGYFADTYETGTNPSGAGILIYGLKVTGTSASPGAVRLLPSSNNVIEHNIFTGFSNGDGVTVVGANSAILRDNTVSYGANGVRLYGTKCLTSSPFTCAPTEAGSTTGYAPNALQVEANGFVSLTGIGIDEDESQGYQTQNLNNRYEGNVLSADATGIKLMESIGAVVAKNYFEANTHNIVVGSGGCCNSQGVIVANNYITGGSATDEIELNVALNSVVTGNEELGSGSTCFLNEGTATDTYIGPNATAATNPYCTGGVAGNASTDTVVAATGTLIPTLTAGTVFVSGKSSAFASQGTYINWNLSAGTGETDLVNVKGASVGGFNFCNVPAAATACGTPVASIDNLGNVNITGQYKINGVALTAPLSGTSGSLGGSALTVNQCSTLPVTVTGATTSMHVFGITPAADPNGATAQNYDWYGQVTAANTVTLKVCALVAGTPTATTYSFLVQ